MNIIWKAEDPGGTIVISIGLGSGTLDGMEGETVENIVYQLSPPTTMNPFLPYEKPQRDLMKNISRDLVQDGRGRQYIKTEKGWRRLDKMKEVQP